MKKIIIIFIISILATVCNAAVYSYQLLRIDRVKDSQTSQVLAVHIEVKCTKDTNSITISRNIKDQATIQSIQTLAQLKALIVDIAADGKVELDAVPATTFIPAANSEIASVVIDPTKVATAANAK